MKYDFKYQPGARSFDPSFGRVINATDGGYERGHAAGYTEGETAGYSNGYNIGVEDGKATAIPEETIIEKTVTGSVIRVYDVSEIPHKCTVSVDADASVTVCGKNLLPEAVYDPNAWESYLDGVTRYAFPLTLLPGTYYLWCERSGSLDLYLQKSSNGGATWASAFFVATGTTITPTQFTVKSGELWRLWIARESSHAGLAKIQVEKGAVFTEYSDPGATYAVTAGQTVEVDSICPNMTLYSDNGANITFRYRKSYGTKLEYDRFWDTFQENGNKGDYTYAFYGSNWDNCFEPKYDLKPTKAEYLFACNTIPNIEEALKRSGVVLDTSICTNGFRMFTRTSTEVIPELDLRKGGYWGEVVSYSDVKIIRKIIFNDTGTGTDITSFFHGVALLEEVRFEGVIPAYAINISACKNLSMESVQSIIDHLKDITGATAQTLTLHATVGAKLTEEQKEAIAAKNWTLVY